MKKFKKEYQSEEAIGEEGYLAKKSLIPLK